MWQPFVSVLVPVRNEERYIERCLYSLAAQDYQRVKQGLHPFTAQRRSPP